MESGNFKIDGLAVPSPSNDGTTFKDIIISRSWDDMHGIFVDKLVRYRKQVTWSYRALSKNKLIEFYNDQIMKCILDTSKRIFTVTTPYPGHDEPIELICYLGTPIEFKPVHSTKYRGITYWEFSLVWTEVEGVGL